MKGSLTMPVGESPRVPEEVGHYLCWERGSPRILVIYWGPGSRDWRLGPQSCNLCLQSMEEP